MLVSVNIAAVVASTLSLFTLSLCDVVPNLPHDPATTPYCTWWVDNDSSISCSDFLATRNISIENFIRWNPFVTSTCGNFGQWTSYCVEAFNEPIQSTTWTDLGCWIDSGKPHALLNAGIASLKLSRDVCKTYCKSQGYSYAGVEGAQECWCDNKITGSLATADNPSLCNMACPGKNAEMCGGISRLNVFSLSTTLVYSSTSISSSSTRTSTRTSTTTSQATTKVTSTTTSAAATTRAALAVKTWIPLGCYIDSGLPRVLSTKVTIEKLTIEVCTAKCAAEGWLYAGVEYVYECWCDSQIRSPEINFPVAASQCGMPCEANSAQSCGDNNRQNIYYAVTIATTAEPTTALTTSTSASSTTTLSTYTSVSPSASKTTTATPKPCPTSVSITFRIPLTVSNAAAGESVNLIGSIDALGIWDIPKSIRMSGTLYTKANPIWTTTVTLTPGTYVEYKYLHILADGSIVWSTNPNYSFTVPTTCVATQEIDDVWR